MILACIPPTLAPPTAKALAAGVRAMVTGSGRGTLATAVEGIVPGWSALTFDRGRSALVSALRVAMRATGRNRIVLPAFTSYSVAAAAVSAGADVVLADLDPVTLDFAPGVLESAVDERTAAVVLGNLFGFPSSAELPAVRRFGALVIDDAAQALGAVDAGVSVGWRGDIGVLSFGRGKCVTTGDAGALLVRVDGVLAGLAEAEAPRGRPPRGLATWALAGAVAASRSRIVFGILSRLPASTVGQTRYESHLGNAPLTLAADGLATDLPHVIGRQMEVRERVAGWWDSAVAGIPGLGRSAARASVRPANLRYPVRAPSGDARDDYRKRLAAVGFRFVDSYPGALSQIPGFRHHLVGGSSSMAERLAATLIALPCHLGVTLSAVRRAASIMTTAGPAAVLAATTPAQKGQ